MATSSIHRRKPVRRDSLGGSSRTFESITEAALTTKTDPTTISIHCRNKTPDRYGVSWSFVIPTAVEDDFNDWLESLFSPEKVLDAEVRTDYTVADAPVVDAPVVDAPVADAPVADAPVADALVAGAPAAGSLVTNNEKTAFGAEGITPDTEGAPGAESVLNDEMEGLGRAIEEFGMEDTASMPRTLDVVVAPPETEMVTVPLGDEFWNILGLSCE